MSMSVRAQGLIVIAALLAWGCDASTDRPQTAAEMSEEAAMPDESPEPSPPGTTIVIQPAGYGIPVTFSCGGSPCDPYDNPEAPLDGNFVGHLDGQAAFKVKRTNTGGEHDADRVTMVLQNGLRFEGFRAATGRDTDLPQLLWFIHTPTGTRELWSRANQAKRLGKVRADLTASGLDWMEVVYDVNGTPITLRIDDSGNSSDDFDWVSVLTE